MSESTLVKMPHCWKSHVAAHFLMTANDSDLASCDACGLEVTDTDIICDTFSQWYHPIYENMGDFQQCGILTNVGSYEPLQPPFKLRNSK